MKLSEKAELDMEECCDCDQKLINVVSSQFQDLLDEVFDVADPEISCC